MTKIMNIVQIDEQTYLHRSLSYEVAQVYII